MFYTDFEIEWAKEKLGVSSGDKNELMAVLRKEDFVLEYADDVAVRILMGQQTDRELPRRMLLEKIKARVFEFSSAYFDYSIHERNKIYSEFLKNADAFPELKPRLLELQKGLNIEKPSEPGPVSSFILKTYTLPLNKKSAKFNELISMNKGSRKLFSKEYKNLKRSNPELCSLCVPLDDLLIKTELKEYKPDEFHWIWLVVIFAGGILFGYLTDNDSIDTSGGNGNSYDEPYKPKKRSSAVNQRDLATGNRFLKIISRHTDKDGNVNWAEAKKELAKERIKILGEAEDIMNKNKNIPLPKKLKEEKTEDGEIKPEKDTEFE